MSSCRSSKGAQLNRVHSGRVRRSGLNRAVQPRAEEVLHSFFTSTAWFAEASFDVSLFFLEIAAFKSTGIIHFCYISAALLSIGSYFSTGIPQPSMLFQVLRRLIWDIGSFTSHVLTQWDIAFRLSRRSQVGELMAVRECGICHYCLPTGFPTAPYCEDDRYVQARVFAHRCTGCTLRHFVAGDRPMYTVERYHHRLLHRAQHVVCSDREKSKGMLANINLTHSAIVEEPSLDKQYSYQTYLAHAVRAELLTLGGDIQFLPNRHFGTQTGVRVTGPQSGPSADASAPSATVPTADEQRPSGSSNPDGASRFIEPGTPLIPYTTADAGKPMEGVQIITDWEKVDLRKDMGRKMEALAVLEHEAKSCIVDDDVLEQLQVTAKARIAMPGVTDKDITAIHVACNSHSNAIAKIGNRRYAEKFAEVEYDGIAFKNQIGNPWELIRRAVHAVVDKVLPAILEIDEETIRRQDTELMEIPQSEIVSELHGKSLFPMHKSVDEIAPSSFTEQMKKDNFEAASGTELTKLPPTKAFVKPNEALGKIKPRLIQHTGPQGTAAAALMNKTVEQMIFRLPYFVQRSIKGTDNTGVCERVRLFYYEYKSGGFASTDFGSFDSSITDKCTVDRSKPGLRRIIEEAIMKAVTNKFPEAFDVKNVSKTRWKKKDKILFDTLTLFTEVLIRYSGDGLTSVGNYAINWFVDRSIYFVLERIFTMWDMRVYTLKEIIQFLTNMIDDPEFINQVLEGVKKKATRLAETIIRVSKGLHVTKEDSEFLNGEGDDRLKGFRWAFIQKFETKDKKGKDARQVLGVMTAVMYTAAGMSLEPQDRTGRVSAEKLIDKSQRIELISRIFVPLNDGKAMRSFPKLRKTFAAATITFNVNDPFLTAAATKMLSIMMMCEQCPLQFPFYSLIYRYYRGRITDETIITGKRKYEWWELKLMHLITDNGLQNSMSAIYAHLMNRAYGYVSPEIADGMLDAVAAETRLAKNDLVCLIDALNGAKGDDLGSVQDLVQRYVAILPPV